MTARSDRSVGGCAHTAASRRSRRTPGGSALKCESSSVNWDSREEGAVDSASLRFRVASPPTLPPFPALLRMGVCSSVEPAPTPAACSALSNRRSMASCDASMRASVLFTWLRWCALSDAARLRSRKRVSHGMVELSLPSSLDTTLNGLVRTGGKCGFFECESTTDTLRRKHMPSCRLDRVRHFTSTATNTCASTGGSSEATHSRRCRSTTASMSTVRPPLSPACTALCSRPSYTSVADTPIVAGSNESPGCIVPMTTGKGWFFTTMFTNSTCGCCTCFPRRRPPGFCSYGF
mmetsp:Transcript_1291/g.3084  ORF Transcript_1291/g.3084 Transcript_1291/m.3084 type:complete len:292 (+) Transcript_1291:79-954(+)